MSRASDFLRKIFGIKQQYLRTVMAHLPVENVNQLMSTKTGKAFLERVHNMEIDLKRYQQEDLQREAENDSKRENAAINNFLIKQENENKEKKKWEGVTFKIDIPKGSRYPSHSTKYEHPMGKFYGLRLESLDDGTCLWYPVVLEDGKKLKIESPVNNPNHLFKFFIRVPQQIHSGKVVSNIVFTKNKKPKIEVDSKTLHDDADSDLKVKVVQMDLVERQEYEQEIATLKQNYGQLYSKYQQIADREVEYENKVNELSVNNKNLSTDRDINAAFATNLLNGQNEMVFNVAMSNSSLQDEVVNRLMAEKMNKQLWKKLDKMSTKFIEVYDEYMQAFPNKSKDDVMKDLAIVLTKEIREKKTAPQSQPASSPGGESGK